MPYHVTNPLPFWSLLLENHQWPSKPVPGKERHHQEMRRELGWGWDPREGCKGGKTPGLTFESFFRHTNWGGEGREVLEVALSVTIPILHLPNPNPRPAAPAQPFPAAHLA